MIKEKKRNVTEIEREREGESERIYEISILGFGSRIQHRTMEDKNNSYETLKYWDICGQKICGKI